VLSASKLAVKVLLTKIEPQRGAGQLLTRDEPHPPQHLGQAIGS